MISCVEEGKEKDVDGGRVRRRCAPTRLAASEISLEARGARKEFHPKEEDEKHFSLKSVVR